jgi:hypothetical protein
MSLTLQEWMNLNEKGINETAKLFDVSHSHIYKYLVGASTPKPIIMREIFWQTKGLVTANDFYGTTEEFFKKRVRAELNRMLKEEGEKR